MPEGRPSQHHRNSRRIYERMKPQVRTMCLPAPVSLWDRLFDYLELTKPRLNALAIAATLAALYLASPQPPEAMLCIHVFLATSLVAGGAAALNQLMERDRDALMQRTADRPLPAGRLSPRSALIFGMTTAIGGVLYFAAVTNLTAAALALATLVSYLLLYTPLKTKTWLNTLVGAVPGALPLPLGWAASGEPMGPVIGVLFAIVFCWQIPHFFAIATVYRDDYQAGGFPMLPVIDRQGRRTCRQVLLFAVTLIPVSLLPVTMGLSGNLYFHAAWILGLVQLGFAIDFARRKTSLTARRLFFASIVYLPLLLVMMMINKS